MHTSFWRDLFVIAAFFFVLFGAVNVGLWLMELFPVFMTILCITLFAVFAGVAYSYWLDEENRR
jgi:hypothetical protein